MKKPLKSTLLSFCILATLPLLTQCAPQSEVQNLHYQLRLVSKKVDSMKAETVTSIQKRQASSSSQLDLLQTDITQLKSRVEELAHLNRMLQEQQKEDRAALQAMSTKLQRQEEEAQAIKTARIQEAEKKAYEAQVAAARAQALRKKAEISATRSRNKSDVVETIYARKGNKVIKYTPTVPEPETQPQPNQAPTAQKTSTIAVDTPLDTLMLVGKQAFEQADYQKALNNFQQIVDKNPSSSLSLTARFMIAESLFHMNQYNQAIMQYQKIISSYPRDPKSATALLRQGNSFEKLSDLETAKMIYKKLISSHADSPEATQAKKLLNNL